MAKDTCYFKQNILQYIAIPDHAVYFLFMVYGYFIVYWMKASKMDFLAKMINSFQSLNSFAKSFTLDV